MHLAVNIIAHILASASPQIRRDAGGAQFAFFCTVEEGADCRFTGGQWDDPVLRPLRTGIVDQLGWKTLEHARRREALVRCQAPGGVAALARCEIDCGDGAQPLPVRAEEEDRGDHV